MAGGGASWLFHDSNFTSSTSHVPPAGHLELLGFPTPRPNILPNSSPLFNAPHGCPQVTAFPSLPANAPQAPAAAPRTGEAPGLGGGRGAGPARPPQPIPIPLHARPCSHSCSHPRSRSRPSPRPRSGRSSAPAAASRDPARVRAGAAPPPAAPQGERGKRPRAWDGHGGPETPRPFFLIPFPPSLFIVFLFLFPFFLPPTFFSFPPFFSFRFSLR